MLPVVDGCFIHPFAEVEIGFYWLICYLLLAELFVADWGFQYSSGVDEF